MTRSARRETRSRAILDFAVAGVVAVLLALFMIYTPRLFTGLSYVVLVFALLLGLAMGKWGPLRPYWIAPTVWLLTLFAANYLSSQLATIWGLVVVMWFGGSVAGLLVGGGWKDMSICKKRKSSQPGEVDREGFSSINSLAVPDGGFYSAQRIGRVFEVDGRAPALLVCHRATEGWPSLALGCAS